MLAFLLFVAAPVQAAPVPAPPPPTADQRQLSALLDLVLPADTIVAAQLAEWRPVLERRFDNDPALVKRAKSDAALKTVMVGAGLKAVETTYRQGLWQLRGDAGRIYSQGLNPREIGELLAFFQTPTGRKFVTAMHRGIASSSRQTPDGLRADGQRQAMSTLDASDRPVLERFARTRAFQKSGQVSPRIAEASNRQISALTARLPDVVAAAWNKASAERPVTGNPNDRARGAGETNALST